MQAIVEENEDGRERTFHLSIGCERGRHRSVVVVEAIAQELQKNNGFSDNICIAIFHRDLDG